MRSRSVHTVLLPVLLLAAGAGALVYGHASREVPVWTIEMVEKEEIILERPPAPMWDGPSGPGGRRSLPPPPPRPKKVTVTVEEDREVPYREPRLTREVTVGGIARLEDGRLKLTYGPGDRGPALCPT